MIDQLHVAILLSPQQMSLWLSIVVQKRDSSHCSPETSTVAKSATALSIAAHRHRPDGCKLLCKTGGQQSCVNIASGLGL